MMKQILALLSWGLICIPKEPEAFTFAKMEVGHPVSYRAFMYYMTMHLKKEILELKLFSQKVFKIPTILQLSFFKSVGQLLQKFES